VTNRTAKIYPTDSLLTDVTLDVINSAEAQTLDELFRERVRRSANQVAYSQFDVAQQKWLTLNWAEVAQEVERWQVAFRQQGLNKGDRVAIRHRNSIEWVVFDQAALRLGLVVVPLYTADRPDNAAFVVADSGAKLVFCSNIDDWLALAASDEDDSNVDTVLVLESVSEQQASTDKRLIEVGQWLPEDGQHLERGLAEADDLASIVYTSGTTGRPKGVMLSHKNMLSNVYAGIRSVSIRPADHLLSFLPLSHTLERTVGYYGTMMCGARTTFNRSIDELLADMVLVKPTMLISVPRIFERAYNGIHAKLADANPLKQALFKLTLETGWTKFEYQQGLRSWHPCLLLAGLLDKIVAKPIRAIFGGNLESAIVGGAPLSCEVAKTFIGLGIPLLQGYGLTESSPVISCNTITQNRPDSIGLPLRGVEVKLMDNDELWAKGDNIMQGYWGRPEDTDKTMHDGWLKTGDRASIDEQGFIRIIGRIKDILVLANGEKVPPPDIEAAILGDSTFEQALVVGEGKPYLSAIVVLSKMQWQKLCDDHGWSEDALNSDEVHLKVIERIAARMTRFPGYARIRRVHLSLDEWTVESGLVTPTLKMKRPQLVDHFTKEIDDLYEGHGLHS